MRGPVSGLGFVASLSKRFLNKKRTTGSGSEWRELRGCEWVYLTNGRNHYVLHSAVIVNRGNSCIGAKRHCPFRNGLDSNERKGVGNNTL